MNSMLVFEVLRMGKLYEESWYQKWANITNLGKFPKLYRYMYRAVPVQPNIMETVPVQVQAVPVHPNIMQPVLVQVKGVLV